ncbi:MAG: SIS domain-containing protein [Anaerolineales bacterium]
MDSLLIQSEHAIEFIITTWPEVRDQARQTLKSMYGDIDNIILCGCGDSHHAALGLEMAFAIWTRRSVRAASAMMASRYLVPRLNLNPSRTLLIGISASGEVARTLEAVELGVSAGVQTLALTGVADSALAQAALRRLWCPIPTIPIGPGLLSFLSSLLMGYAVIDVLTSDQDGEELEGCMKALPARLESWTQDQTKMGRTFAEEIEVSGQVVFLGCGPAFGMAQFAAAKLVEAAGVPAWGQDGEEWTHIEYFAEPSGTPTWLLSAGGRSSTRESEIIAAAQAIGRGIKVSRWEGDPQWSPRAREALSPLALWSGPVAFASRVAARLGEVPFRGFRGGRSAEEGGGPSRIRSSARFRDLNELDL